MDRNSPDFYVEKTEEAVENLKEFVNDKMFNDKDDIVQPILTPRFVPSCTEKLMNEIGDIHKHNNQLLIQSHVS